ncbi:MAG: hypothetical protein QXV04_05260, partial [Desulfurococcaceae archaeon]
PPMLDIWKLNTVEVVKYCPLNHHLLTPPYKPLNVGGLYNLSGVTFLPVPLNESSFLAEQ